MRRFVLIHLCLVALLLMAGLSWGDVSKKRFSVATDSTTVVDVPTNLKPENIGEKKVGLWDQFAGLQRQLRENVSQKITAMQDGDMSLMGTFLMLCFLYGMLHALGPGHGKSIVIGYFLARRGKWPQGLALGAGITFTHTFSAVVLLLAMYGVLKATVFPSFELGREGIEKVSYGMVMLTGVLLMTMGVLDFRKQNRGVDKAMNPSMATAKEIIAVAAITGIVPCPAVALIVLFCLLHSLVGLSLLSAVAICLGMTVTNMLFGLLAVAMRKGVDHSASKFENLAKFIYMGASLVGGFVVFASGFGLLMTC